jgi:outer membrane protein assembly factor BamB
MLFSASDGYFYALNLADGTIAWKTKVDTQNLFSFANSTMYLFSPNFQIDSKDQRLFWSFAVKQGDSPGNYTATLCSLDLANGNVTWTKQIEATWVNAPLAGLALNNDKIFLTGNNALLIFNASTGDLLQGQQFDHYVLPPIVLGNETFVAADLWLTAYA